jgi:hypothetical protein
MYLDEDVDVLIGRVLRFRGHDVITTIEAGHLESSDAAQLRFAVESGRAIVTHNRSDFEELATQLFEMSEHHRGIIIARKRLPYDIVERLLPILVERTQPEMIDQLLYI